MSVSSTGLPNDMTTRTVAAPETFTFASRVDQAPIFVRNWLPPAER
jgi:hypothetical protein